MYPKLLIGPYARGFKKDYLGIIDSVSNPEDVRNLVTRYMSIPRLERELVIEDLTFLSPSAQQTLLKLVEESTLDIVLLASYDNVPYTLLSRCRTIQKGVDFKVSSKFHSLGKGYRAFLELDMSDSHHLVKVREMAKLSPVLFRYGQSFSGYQSKILQILD